MGPTAAHGEGRVHGAADLRAGRAVVRQRLLARLDAIPAGGTGIVVASAGSGKSVLLEQWTARGRAAGRAVAHLRIGNRSRDQVVLVRQLSRALDQVVPGLAAGLVELTSAASGRLGPLVIEEMLAELAGLDAPLDIVLDDAHLLGGLPELGAEAADLLVDLPPQVRVVLGARWDPDVGIPRLRAAGRLVELRTADLAFDVEEAEAMAEAFGQVPLDPAGIRALVDRTDGWAVGLQLAFLSLVDAYDPAAFLAGFTGSDRLVAEYLLEEVLDRQEPELRRFLLRTSVLPWLSAELCAALDDDDLESARRHLGALVERSLFVIPLDAHGDRFRYHHLFADLLTYQLRAEDPAGGKRARRRAARWFDAAGRPDEAAGLLIELGDEAALIDLVHRHGPDLFARSETATVLRWLDQLRTTAGTSSPALAVELIAAQMASHQTADVLDTYHRLRNRDDLTTGQRIAVDAVYCCAGLDDLPLDEVERSASSALELLPTVAGGEVPDFLGIGGAPSAAVMARYMLAVAALHRGDLDSAADQLERTATLDGASYPLWRISILSTLGLVRAWSAEHAVAVADAEEALSVADAMGSRSHHAATQAYIALALVALDRLDITAAARHLAAAEVCVQRSQWSVDRALHQLVRAHLVHAAEGPAAAIDALEPVVPPLAVPPLVGCAIGASRARMLGSMGKPAQARAALASCPAGPAADAAAVDVALGSDDLPAARATLEAWPADGGSRRDRLGRMVRWAALLAGEGDRAAAEDAMADALELAEAHGTLSVFTEVPGAIALVRSTPRLRTLPFADRILGAAATVGRRRPGPDVLVVPLTRREEELLPYLPTRLTNAEIAQELYVSVNTVKTHLRRVYLKLDVRGRDEAVQRASELGLL